MWWSGWRRRPSLSPAIAASPLANLGTRPHTPHSLARTHTHTATYTPYPCRRPFSPCTATVSTPQLQRPQHAAHQRLPRLSGHVVDRLWHEMGKPCGASGCSTTTRARSFTRALVRRVGTGVTLCPPPHRMTTRAAASSVPLLRPAEPHIHC